MNIELIGAALGLGAQNPASEHGPDYFQKHYSFNSNKINWKEIIHAHKNKDKFDNILTFLSTLELTVNNTVSTSSFPIIIGGDHSIAIGTWAGVINALKKQQTSSNLGLLWIDAHLDSHTFETSPSKAIHGMPLATLLGYGHPQLLNIGNNPHRLNPKNVVVLGARSWEEGERKLLDTLGVTIIDMKEINENGILISLEKAYSIIHQNTTHFGITLDLDVFDPSFVPGVCSKENDGVDPYSFIEAIKKTQLLSHPHLAALEITEFAPEEDQNEQTFEIMKQFINLFVSSH